MENLYDLLSNFVDGRKVIYQNHIYKIQEFSDEGYLRLKSGDISLKVPLKKFKNIELIVKKPKSIDKITHTSTKEEFLECQRNIEEEYEKIREATRFPLI